LWSEGEGEEEEKKTTFWRRGERCKVAKPLVMMALVCGGTLNSSAANLSTAVNGASSGTLKLAPTILITNPIKNSMHQGHRDIELWDWEEEEEEEENMSFDLATEDLHFVRELGIWSQCYFEGDLASCPVFPKGASDMCVWVHEWMEKSLTIEANSVKHKKEQLSLFFCCCSIWFGKESERHDSKAATTHAHMDGSCMGNFLLTWRRCWFTIDFPPIEASTDW
jgi:hypothetical protein